MMNETDTMGVKALDEKLCNSCDAIIHIKAEICPKCGVRQTPPISKAVLLLITFFLGGIGGHKFYTGRYWQGAFSLIFCWTGIPGIIALIEFIIYACASSESLEEKYVASGAGVVIIVVAGGVGFIFILGILAAIAIPQFVKYRHRAYENSVSVQLQSVLTAEKLYRLENGKYTQDMDMLDLREISPGIRIRILSADEDCFQAVGRHDFVKKDILIDCNGFQ